MRIRTINQGRYLLDTSTGFCFRMKVPKRHREHFSRREFKKALHTTDAKDAQKKALLLAAMIDEHIAQLDVAKGFKMARLPFFSGIKIDEIDVSMQGIRIRGVEQDPLHPETESRLLRENIEAAREEYQKLINNQQVASVAQISMPSMPASTPTKLFAELIEDFVTEKTTSGNWDVTSSNGRKEQLLRGLEYFGNRDIATITRDEAREFMDILANLPPNIKKNKAYSGMSLKDIAAKNTLCKVVAEVCTCELCTF